MSNRTTVKSNVSSKIVPKVTNAIHIDVLNNDVCDNIRFIEDVATTQSSTVSAITCDFTGKDRIDLTRTGGSLNITLSGIGDGATKFLLITKTAGQAVTFTGGVTDITPVADDVTAATTVLYEIVRKNTSYFAKAWVGIGAATTDRAGILETATATEANGLSVTNKIITPGTVPVASDTQQGVVERATSSECNALSDTSRFVTPGRIPIAGLAQRGVVELASQSETFARSSSALAVTPNSLIPIDWASATGLESGWSGTLQYFRDMAGNVHFRTNDLKRSTGFTGTSGQPVWEIPAGYVPDADCYFVVSALNGSSVATLHRAGIVNVGGYYLYIYPEPDDYVANTLLSFYIIFSTNT